MIEGLSEAEVKKIVDEALSKETVQRLGFEFGVAIYHPRYVKIRYFGINKEKPKASRRFATTVQMYGKMFSKHYPGPQRQSI